MYKKIIIIIIFSIIFFIFGFILSNLLNKNKSDISYQAGWDAAKNRLYETGILESVEQNYPIKSVIGNIIKIDNNKIYLKINPVEALSKKELDNRIIIINENTKVYRYYKKSEDDIAMEKEELLRQKILQEPDIFEKKEVLKSELKLQSRIIAHSLKDIRNNKQFISSEIIIQK